MQIKNLFERDIFRSINGVVKAQQLDDFSVWQELDEFVFTKELDKYFRKFLTAFLDAIDHGNDPNITGKMAVWIAGFFGSGKSHFLKVLSYLLKNDLHSYQGQSKKAVDFFLEKIKDAMLFGDVQRAVASNTDVILFNIDSKADNKAGREAILTVFLKVLNETQGYDGDHPHIAHMERHLDSKGKLAAFHAAFKAATGLEWLQERDAYEFSQDQVVEALSQTLGQSREAMAKWIDNAESNFSLTVENFCKWVKEYLDSKGPDHRLVFLVDEIGQYIGSDGHRMLNLQTIVEDLGTVCKGRAWVIVTSQEEIDKVIGELRTAAANDFSKIQGRFNTRLSLSSANVDEVIQARLLAKREEVEAELKDVFTDKGDILKSQLTFTGCGMTLKSYKDGDDFCRNYPFAPFQFQLIQKIFEQIRKVGATGLHLAKGERSMLDAFQSAAKTAALQEVGVLVPLYDFYPSIESFLDTTVKRTIDQAAQKTSLEPFDIKLLQVLFLIRYVDEMKSTVDNLVVLCIDQIDADKLALRRRIEDSLGRLEKETLINRTGDTYFFLTNEERDVSREVKGTDLASGEEATLLGDIIFNDVLKTKWKHRYSVNKMDFPFVGMVDMHPMGRRVEGNLVVSVISPLGDDYEYFNDQKCVMESTNENGQALIRLRDDECLGRELRIYAKTEKYLRTKSDSGLPEPTKRILRDNAEENRQRRERLAFLIGQMLVEAGYFVAGQPLEQKAAAPGVALDNTLEYLITNTFTKMGYLKHLHLEPQKEIQSILRSNDIAQQTLALNMDEANPQAIDDLRNYVELCHKTSKQIVLHDMIENRYANRPYGWPSMEVVMLVARQIVLGEISLVMEGSVLPLDKVYDALTTPNRWRKITILKRHTPDPAMIQKARQIGKDVFSEIVPDGEDPCVTFLKAKLRSWETSLASYKPLADTGNYPGQQEIVDCLSVVKSLLACDDSYKFIERFNERKSDLLELSDTFRDLEHFYEHQKPTWDKLRKACDRFQLNRMELDQDAKAAPAIQRMQEILQQKEPYSNIKEAEGLITTVEAVNTTLVSGRRSETLAKIDQNIAEVTKELAAAQADTLRSTCLGPLEKLRKQVERQESVAHITQAEQAAVQAVDAAMSKIEEAAKKKQAEQKQPTGSDPRKPVVKPRCVVKPAELVASGYLETTDDVNQFIDQLRQQLDQAIASGQRIQIR
ncbi:MAG: BREX system P-loop protein BrxC [Planctomycetota bacterium]